jgi:hypothetical protein
MIPHDIQPICQEMIVKVNDDFDGLEKQNNKKLKTNDSDFNSIINKTKQQGFKKINQILLIFYMI